MGDFFSDQLRPGLFRSRVWLDAWQQAWGDCAELLCSSPLELRSDSILDQEKKFAATEKVYFYRDLMSGVIPVITAFPEGLSVKPAPAIRNEYFQFCPFRSSIRESVEYYFSVLLKQKWDQFFISDLPAESLDYQALKDFAKKQGLLFIVKEEEVSYGVALQGSTFEHYLAQLGANTRLKLFNRRKKVSARGSFLIKNVWPDVDTFISLLNEFHLQRWHKPCYADGSRNEKFIRLLLSNLANVGDGVDLSVMYIGEQPVSAVLDLEVQGRVYNIQSGYLEEFMPGVSLGTLHFGYQIEKAFKDKHRYYDFMAGKGKNSDYKKSLSTVSTPSHKVILIRSPLLKFAYQCKNTLKQLAR